MFLPGGISHACQIWFRTISVILIAFMLPQSPCRLPPRVRRPSRRVRSASSA